MVHALVLAGGKGTRMHSLTPKVLQPILGESMLYYVLKALSSVCTYEQISILTGYKHTEIDSNLPQIFDSLSFPIEGITREEHPCLSTTVQKEGGITRGERPCLSTIVQKEGGITRGERPCLSTTVQKEEGITRGERPCLSTTVQKEGGITRGERPCLSTTVQKEGGITRGERPCLSTIVQKEQLGTGHALQVAWKTLEKKGIDSLLVINGDVPLLEEEHLRFLLDESEKRSLDVAFLTTILPDTGMYGLVCRKEGVIHSIVEAKDYSKEIHGLSNEINTGIYYFSMKTVSKLLPQLQNNNANKEFYITDIIALAKKEGLAVEGLVIENAQDLLGINTPQELVEAEERLRNKICTMWMKKGVHIHHYNTVCISPSSSIASGVVIYGPSCITGKTIVKSDVVIDPYCTIHDSTIEENTHICSFSHIDTAHIGAQCRIGPYARIRPESNLSNNVRIGNFVEIKKSTLNANVAVNHLSYIGDTQVGAFTNIGAGTITCNYDGTTKHTTHIGEHVFVGSLTALVAPVTIEDHSTIGAGSVITKNVLAHTLALTRTEQISRHKK